VKLQDVCDEEIKEARIAKKTAFDRKSANEKKH